MLPPFIRYNCAEDTFVEISVDTVSGRAVEPSEFGDDWIDPLLAEDQTRLNYYFRLIAHLFDFLNFITFRVGGRDHHITFNRGKYRRGVTFEAPRNSLMTCVEQEIFNDMLIGNFMKMTLHGHWGNARLFPDFVPYVTKYADNGQAKLKQELARYMEQYRRRAPLEFLVHRLEFRTKNLFRDYVTHDSRLYRVVRNLYHRHT